MAKIKQGKIITVNNKDRKFGANENYYAIWIEDNKKQEKCLLFTEHQLTVAQDRASKNLEDIPKKGFWYNLFD
jgi:hypothetical protein|tara:strand:- start:180 stop:398 length:219 start_codon:yes stop_codon:yes gene_type:complete